MFTDIGLIQQNGVHVIPTSEIIVGQLLHLGVSTCPKLAKAWVQFAAWCYRWGRRVVDATSQAGGGQLSESDRLAVQQILPAGIAINDLDRVYYILGQTRALADEEDIEVCFFTQYKTFHVSLNFCCIDYLVPHCNAMK